MRFGFIFLLLVWLIGFSSPISAQEASHASYIEHIRWLEDRVKEAESIKVGMSHAELLKLFVPQGGFAVQTNPPNLYVLKSCSMIHIEVTFNVDEEKALTGKKTNFDDLRIEHISPLYLGWTASD